jgi:hypothetical protein
MEAALTSVRIYPLDVLGVSIQMHIIVRFCWGEMWDCQISVIETASIALSLT